MSLIDGVGQAFYLSVWAAVPLSLWTAWRQKWLYTWQRVLFGALFGFSAAAILYMVSIAICFRNGMGP